MVLTKRRDPVALSPPIGLLLWTRSKRACAETAACLSQGRSWSYGGMVRSSGTALKMPAPTGEAAFTELTDTWRCSCGRFVLTDTILCNLGAPSGLGLNEGAGVQEGATLRGPC